MTVSLEELSDRAEIEDALHGYAQAQDQDRWDLYDLVFTADAVIEFPGLPFGSLTADQLRAFLKDDFNATRLSGQHLITNVLIEIDGDSARSVAEVLHVTLQRTDTDGEFRRSRGGSLYADSWSRTSDGWRITRRVATQKHLENATVTLPPELVETIEAGASADWFVQREGTVTR